MDAPEANVKAVRKALLANFTPLINKGGLKKHDETVISLLHALNEKAREQNLSQRQQLDMLQSMMPQGPLKSVIRLSRA